MKLCQKNCVLSGCVEVLIRYPADNLTPMSVIRLGGDVIIAAKAHQAFWKTTSRAPESLVLSEISNSFALLEVTLVILVDALAVVTARLLAALRS
jgi:hypothetical protein